MVTEAAIQEERSKQGSTNSNTGTGGSPVSMREAFNDKRAQAGLAELEG